MKKQVIAVMLSMMMVVGSIEASVYAAEASTAQAAVEAREGGSAGEEYVSGEEPALEEGEEYTPGEEPTLEEGEEYTPGEEPALEEEEELTPEESEGSDVVVSESDSEDENAGKGISSLEQDDEEERYLQDDGEDDFDEEAESVLKTPIEDKADIAAPVETESVKADVQNAANKSNVDVNNKEIVSFQGHYYQLFTESKTWKEAEKYCESLGGHLATITTKEEKDFIAGLCQTSRTNYWIGGTDEESEGNWKWVTGEKWEYTNWNNGEPSNSQLETGIDEDYLQVSVDWGHKWNDSANKQDNTAAIAFICEWDFLQQDYFIIGRDSNSFQHTSDLFGIGRNLEGRIGTAYTTSLYYYGKLCDGLNGSQNVELLDRMNGEWKGSCEGLSISMGMSFLKKIDISGFKGRNGSAPTCYNDLQPPYNNLSFRDLINYYHLLQTVDKHNNPKGWLLNLTDGIKILDGRWTLSTSIEGTTDFWQGFAKYVKEADAKEKPLLLSMSFTVGGTHVGHTILTCGYKETDRYYIIKLYDCNQVGLDYDYLYLFIDKWNYGFTFSTTDDTISEYTLFNDWSYFEFFSEKDWEEIDNSIESVKRSSRTSSAENAKADSNNAYLFFTVSSGEAFRLENGSGQYLQFKNGSLSNTLDIYEFEPLNDGSEYRFKVLNSKDLILSEFDDETKFCFRTDSDYVSVKTQNADKIRIQNNKTVSIDGDAFSYDLRLSMNSESSMMELMGNSNENVIIEHSDNDISISAHEPDDIKVSVYDSEGKVYTKYFPKSDETTIHEDEIVKPALPGKTTRGDMFNLANNVKVTWKEVPGAKYYKVYRYGLTNTKETRRVPVIVTTGLVGWDKEPGLTNGHKYKYTIIASLTGKGDSSGDSELYYTKLMYRLKTVVIRSAKNTVPGGVLVKYDKTTSGDSYVLQYSDKADMSGAKTRVVKGANTTSYMIGGLKKGKTYYISIRVRKTVDGINYYTTFGVPTKVTITK